AGAGRAGDHDQSSCVLCPASCVGHARHYAYAEGDRSTQHTERSTGEVGGLPPHASHMRLLIFVRKDVAQMLAAVNGALRDRRLADATAILRHDLRSDAEDAEDQA